MARLAVMALLCSCGFDRAPAQAQSRSDASCAIGVYRGRSFGCPTAAALRSEFVRYCAEQPWSAMIGVACDAVPLRIERACAWVAESWSVTVYCPGGPQITDDGGREWCVLGRWSFACL